LRLPQFVHSMVVVLAMGVAPGAIRQPGIQSGRRLHDGFKGP
jgi:hypothetical protein